MGRSHTSEIRSEIITLGNNPKWHYSSQWWKNTQACNRLSSLSRAYGLTIYSGSHSGDKPYTGTACLALGTTSGQLKFSFRNQSGREAIQGQYRFRKTYSSTYQNSQWGQTTPLYNMCNWIHRNWQSIMNGGGDKCKECSVIHTTSGQLKSHSRIHSGEKPYKCDTCLVIITQASKFIKNSLRGQTIQMWSMFNQFIFFNNLWYLCCVVSVN